MKRGGGLRRMAPLLARPRQTHHRTTPLRARTLTEAEQVRRAQVRHAVFDRDGWQCAATGVVPHVCHGPLTVHHLLKAGQGGTYEETNLLALCAYANGWVETAPDAAHAVGLVVRRGESVADCWRVLRALGATTYDPDAP